MHNGKASGDPSSHFGLRDDRLTGAVADGRNRRARRRIFSDLLLHIPEKIQVRTADPRIVRARLIDDRDLEPFAVGLSLTGHIYVHPVESAVTIGIEFGLHPQVMSNPSRRIGK